MELGDAMIMLEITDSLEAIRSRIVIQIHISMTLLWKTSERSYLRGQDNISNILKEANKCADTLVKVGYS